MQKLLRTMFDHQNRKHHLKRILTILNTCYFNARFLSWDRWLGVALLSDLKREGALLNFVSPSGLLSPRAVLSPTFFLVAHHGSITNGNVCDPHMRSQTWLASESLRAPWLDASGYRKILHSYVEIKTTLKCSRKHFDKAVGYPYWNVSTDCQSVFPQLV